MSVRPEADEVNDCQDGLKDNAVPLEEIGNLKFLNCKPTQNS